MKKNVIVSLLLALVLAVSALALSACGGSGEESVKPFEYGDYVLQYEGYELTKDEDGNDAIVLTYQFTNNSEEAGSMYWTVWEYPYQDDEQLDAAVIFVDEDSQETVSDSMYEEVEPGESTEVRTAYLLKDTSTPVKVELKEFGGDNSTEFTISIK